MSSPDDLITVARVRNPDASNDLELVIELGCNTSDEVLDANIRVNSAREDIPWLGFAPAHEGVAVIVGGGPSAVDSLPEIADMVENGAVVFALNGASKWLRLRGINAPFQIMIDARPENLTLLDPDAEPLLASQVAPEVMAAAKSPTLVHLMTVGVEDCLPDARRARGGYAVLGGGYGVGNTAICVAYVMGYRTIHCFGFDSSNRNGKSHAYAQPMNDGEPTIETEWGGVTYTSSLPMKAHAERFQIIAADLKRLGCRVVVHGDGLLPAMYNANFGSLPEADKYRLIWQFDSYREFSPGEREVERFMRVAAPRAGEGVIDFGCGTGRAAVLLAKAGLDPLMTDFAPNCLDNAATHLPFMLHDLRAPMPGEAMPWGFCADVMEHIPTGDVRPVLKNILAAAGQVYFHISTVDDVFGDLVGGRLHLTVKPHDWWRDALVAAGGTVNWEADEGTSSSFLVSNQVSEQKEKAA